MRPAVCLTNPVGTNLHIIVAFITSQITTELLETDIVLNTSHPDFAVSGLRKPSILRLDHLMTIRKSLILRELGMLSSNTQAEIAEKLCKLLTE